MSDDEVDEYNPDELEDKAEDATVEAILAKSGLTEKRASFVREWCIDHNATQAALRAGYSVNTAHSQGSRLLKNVEVAKAVHKIQSARAMALDFGKGDVIATHVQIIRSITTTTIEKQRSLERLEKIYGMTDDQLKIIGDMKLTHEQALDALDDEPEETGDL